MRPFTQTREAVRVKVKKYDGKLAPDIQKFSVDPQITSLDVLQSILIKAFNLKDDFSLSYKIANDGHGDYMGLFSDWDLDAAFLRAQNVQGSEPCVHLRVDVKSRNEASNPDGHNVNSKWQQKNASAGILKNVSQNPIEQKSSQFGLQGIFMNQMEKTLNMVSRALNLSEDPNIPAHQPLNDAKFRSFLDPVGQVIDGAGLRQVIYSGGIDPSLRRVVWKHILNVYPEGMSGKQRMDYMKRKSLEYFTLRDVWRDCIHKGQVPSDLMYVTSMVKKDVLRTDRHHKFYAGSDDNQNIASLFNILTTYALNHPVVSYCQGMSDLASPLLVTMGDEAHAYICFCALMTRLHPNFLFDGEAMTLKFSHLTESLQVYDPQFYTYLKNQQADDLLFCYRWLLLEMKREFAFDDALRMLEVLWSSLPSRPPVQELLLKEKSFCPIQDEGEAPISPLVKNHGENAYTKLCAMRRQHSSGSLTLSLSTVQKTITYKRINQSLDENIGKKCQSTNSLQLSKEFQSLDDGAISISQFKNLSGNNFNNMLYKSRSKTTTCSSNSVSSSGEQEYNYSELADDDSVFPEDNISNTNHSDSKEQLLQPSSSLLSSSSSEKLQRDVSPVRIIENLNEFKKLSRYAHRNKSATKANSISELKTLNKHINCSSKGNNMIQDTKQLENSLKESEYEDSSPDDSKDYSPMTTSITTELKLESENFDKILCRQCKNNKSTASLQEDIKCENLDCNDHVDDVNIKSNTEQLLHDKFNTKTSDNVFLWENPLHEKIQGIDEMNVAVTLNNSNTKVTNIVDNHIDDTDSSAVMAGTSSSTFPQPSSLPRDSSKSNSRFFSNMSQELENARKNCEILLNNKKPANLHSIAVTISNFQNKYENHLHSSNNISNDSLGEGHSNSIGNTNSVDNRQTEDAAKSEVSDIKQLPSPQLFGGGNPFLMFLCLTVLMQHRDHIMTNRMDYNELAMHFDKMVRKHNVNRVLNQARQMYSQYLKHQSAVDSK